MKISPLAQRIAIAALAFIATTVNAASTITYYHNDLAGSPVAATNASGQVIWRESYRPYGERLTNSAASTDNKIYFTSRRQDVETGLVYMGARYYDPVIGRFISTDPMQFDEQNPHLFNRYAYANNNPYKYNDPDGRVAVPLARFVLGASYEAATALGAATLGGMIGRGLYDWIHKEAEAEQGTNHDNKGQSDDKKADRDSKRLFDKDQRERSRDRSKDADGDPTCEYCGVKTTNEPGFPNSSQIDHIDAWSKGGKTNDDNAANSCRTCNASKGSKELGTQWVPPGPWH